MKNSTNKIWLTALLLTGTLSIQAQELPQPNPPAGGPGQAAKGPNPPARDGKPTGKGPNLPARDGKPGEKMGKPKEGKLIKLTTIKGSVVNPIANDRFEYNGLLIKTSSGNVNVMFPPHMGAQILDKAKNGASVTVIGDEHTDPQGKKLFRLNSIQVNGSLIADTPPVAPMVKDSQEQKTIASGIKELNYGLEKNVNGFTLSSGERVSIPAHIAKQLADQLKANEKIVVTGFAEPKRTGVRYSQETTFIRAQTLNIKGQTYLVR